MLGECGRRGGYFEVVNWPEDVIAQLYKLASISLCPPIQVRTYVNQLIYLFTGTSCSSIHSSVAIIRLVL